MKIKELLPLKVYPFTLKVLEPHFNCHSVFVYGTSALIYRARVSGVTEKK